jgi:hypothetical protein
MTECGCAMGFTWSASKSLTGRLIDFTAERPVRDIA